MSLDPRWISKKALLLLHEESLATFGGARGLRDEGLLDSALARPHNILAYNPDSSDRGHSGVLRLLAWRKTTLLWMATSAPLFFASACFWQLTGTD